MIHVALVGADGTRHELSASSGTSLMQAARDHGVPGIDADCGGSMVCGTCHVLVGLEWLAHLAEPGEMERMILEGVPEPRPDARLSCQIPLTTSLDGLTVGIPARQR